MKLNYYGYYIRDNQKQENSLMDMRDFFRFFCAYKNPTYKNTFMRYPEHVYMLSSTRNLYFFLQTHSSEIVKKINSKDISLGEIADLLSQDESLGFASYVYFDGCYFGFASTLLAPKCKRFVEFVNSIFYSINLPQHSFCLHPLIRKATKEELLSMPFVGTTTIQVSKDNSLYKDIMDFVGGEADEFTDVDSFEGNIPINSGTSSSSALIVTWANFLTRLADNPKELSSKELGEIANEAEVLEFGEPGGMMDHYSTAIGNVIYLESVPKIHVEGLQPQLGAFVLGDSLQPKDTLGILARCRYGMEAIIAKVKQVDPTFSIFTTPLAQADDYKAHLSLDELGLLKANLEDRDILIEGKQLMLASQNGTAPHFDQQFGQLLYRHFANLRDHKRTSTDKINRMVEASMNAGALGGKINGSGGGGCMFMYAPENPEAVAEAIKSEGGIPYIIYIDEGTRIEKQ